MWPDFGGHQGPYSVLVATVLVLDCILLGIVAAGLYLHNTKPITISNRTTNACDNNLRGKATSAPPCTAKKLSRSMARRMLVQRLKMPRTKRKHRASCSSSRRAALASINELRELSSTTLKAPYRHA